MLAWYSEDLRKKGMLLNFEGQAFPFDYLRLSAQLKETGAHAGHVVAVEFSLYWNGNITVETVQAPTREEYAEFAEQLFDIYQKNDREQKARKAALRR